MDSSLSLNLTTLSGSDLISRLSDYLISEIAELVSAYHGNPFISTWSIGSDEDEEAKTCSNSLILPLEVNGVYNFVVEWGDGSSNRIISSDDNKFFQQQLKHTYEKSGQYVVHLNGLINGFTFIYDEETGLEHPSSSQLVDISQWGSIGLGNEGFQFFNCTNLHGFTAIDTPNLTELTNLSSMFEGCSHFNCDSMNSWDTSNIQNMNSMFSKASEFNGNISKWNVGSVTNMAYMFAQCTAFNNNISQWNVSNCQQFNAMFSKATLFNGNLSTWNIRNASHLSYMFRDCSRFNCDLSGWNVQNVTAFRQMFSGALTFNLNYVRQWKSNGIPEQDLQAILCNQSSFVVM